MKKYRRLFETTNKFQDKAVLVYFTEPAPGDNSTNIHYNVLSFDNDSEMLKHFQDVKDWKPLLYKKTNDKNFTVISKNGGMRKVNITDEREILPIFIYNIFESHKWL